MEVLEGKMESAEDVLTFTLDIIEPMLVEYYEASLHRTFPWQNLAGRCDLDMKIAVSWTSRNSAEKLEHRRQDPRPYLLLSM